jgi:hypothetical protein
MTYSSIIQMHICDDCHQGLPRAHDAIGVYWASGWKHYCSECWPRHRNYYQGESGQQAWKRVGNRYEPVE